MRSMQEQEPSREHSLASNDSSESKVRHSYRKITESPFPYSRMMDKWDALDRLDLRFRWGGYGIHVLHCHLVVFPPGHHIGNHKHSEFEFHFIPKGKGIVTMETGSYELKEGLFYLTGPDVLHEQYSDEFDTMHELCLHCEIVALPNASMDDWGDPLEREEAEACIQLLRTMPAIPVIDRYQAMQSFLEAYRAWEEQSVGFYTTLKQSIIQILLRAARMHASEEQSGTIPERDMKDYRFRMATQYIEDNASRSLSLDEVAERLHVSPRQLQRVFRSEGGTTFREWVEHVRLRRICADLMRTDRSIEAIAMEHGYMNPNYLFPVFKQKFGMTPSAYRQLHGSR